MSEEEKIVEKDYFPKILFFFALILSVFSVIFTCKLLTVALSCLYLLFFAGKAALLSRA
jgi:hypothetical protein